jgi:hypothetical protein
MPNPITPDMREIVEIVAANPGTTVQGILALLPVEKHDRRAVSAFCWRATKRGLLKVDRSADIARYTADENWEALAEGESDDGPSMPGVPIVMRAMQTQPNSVFALGARA